MKSHAAALATLTGKPAKRARKAKPINATALVLEAGIVLPWRINTTSNANQNWRARYALAKQQRRNTAAILARTMNAIDLPVIVKLTRIGKGTLDDDNNVSAFKHIRDGVADFMGIKDNDPRVRWQYAQEKGAEYAARIEFIAEHVT